MEASLCSVTLRCETKQYKVSGRKINAIGTPGLFDTNLTNDEMKSQIEKSVIMSLPGPHGFLTR